MGVHPSLKGWIKGLCHSASKKKNPEQRLVVFLSQVPNHKGALYFEITVHSRYSEVVNHKEPSYVMTERGKQMFMLLFSRLALSGINF